MKDEIISLGIEYGEYALDSFFPEGVIKDLPVVGPFFNAIKIGKSIQDYIFINKLRSFLEYTNNNAKWKDRFSSEKECYKISKHLVYIIESCDDDEKLRLIGLAFNWLVIGKIVEQEFFYAASIISKSFFPFLQVLLIINVNERFQNNGDIYDFDAVAHLLSIGALDYDGQTFAIRDRSKNGEESKAPSIIVIVNKYGRLVKELLKAYYEKDAQGE